TIYGGDGSDGVLFFGGTTVDLAAGTASGGDGNDILVDVENLLSSFSANDTFSGNDSNNTFLGGGGDDLLSGRNGDDRLEGGHGNDTLYGGDGNDTADFSDIFTAGGTRITIDISSPQGFAVATVGSGTATIVETDTLFGIEDVLGSFGGDIVYGSSAANRIQADFGDDTIDAGEGNDVIYGGRGDDTIHAGGGDDFIDAGDANTSF